MQTFLPYPEFDRSAKCLDRQRLGKQRVETLQLLRALRGETFGWVNHPAARMWRGYDGALVRYGVAICDEWISRGYSDTCRGKILALFDEGSGASDPPWMGDEGFHAAHRSNLLRKDPTWYGRFGWTEADSLPYVWPA